MSQPGGLREVVASIDGGELAITEALKTGKEVGEKEVKTRKRGSYEQPR